MRESLERVRRVLAERHIGIVMVGGLAFLGVSQLLSLLDNPLTRAFAYIYNRNRPADTLAIFPDGTLPFPFYFITGFSAFVVIYVSVLVYWWVYRKTESGSGESA